MDRSRLVVALVAVAAAALVAPSAASAHARYKSSVPAKGEVVTASPSQVEIVFTEEIQKVAGTYDVQVERDRGASVTAGPPVIDESDRARVTVPLVADLTPGRYVVHWKNVSDADGDPAEGAFSFYVNAQPTTVDLANDQQLESVGAEEETPAGEASPSPAAAATVTEAATSAAPAASPTPAAEAPSDGGGANVVLYVAIGVLVVAVVAAGGAWWLFARRST